MMDLRIDTLAINDSAPRRQPQPVPLARPRRVDSDTSSNENDIDTSPTSTTNLDEEDEEMDLVSALASPNRDSYYTPSSERHVRWSAELAEIIDSPQPKSKGLHKLLPHRRRSAPLGNSEVLVSPHQSSESASSERKQGRRIMNPKGSYLKAKRRQSS